MYLTQGLHRAVQQHPNAIATICAGRTRTHAETVDRIARLAAALRGLGLEEGDRAAILSPKDDRFHEFLGATFWAGGVVVPVNIRWAVPEIAESLAEVDARILVVDDFFAGYLDRLREAHPRLQHVIHAGDGPIPDGALSFEDLIAGSEPMEDVRRGGSDLAGIFYTGGPTGRSHGVMLSLHGLLTSPLGLLASEHFMSRDGVGLHAAPMFHVAAFGIWVAGQIVGGTQVMIPFFEPVAVMTAIQEHHVNEILLVPTMIQLVVDHPRI